MTRTASDRSELIRLATMYCEHSRNTIDNFLALSENEQNRQMRNGEVIAAFEHIFNCGGISINDIYIHPCTDLWSRLYEKYREDIYGELDSPVSMIMTLASTTYYKTPFSTRYT